MSSIADRLRTEVSQLVQRSLKGIDYLTTPDPKVGVTPRTLLHRRGTLALYHYHPVVDEIYRVPLLFVIPTTNNASIFDLARGQSLFEFLLARGYDVYVMDWNTPTREENKLRFENYVLDFIPDCIRRVQEHAGVDEISLVGYCMGGVLSSMYAALHADGPLKNLVCFTTPVDWRHMFFGKLADKEFFNVDRMLDADGLVPTSTVQRAIEMHRPATRLVGQIRLWDNMWNDDFVKAYRLMVAMGQETVPLAGEYYRQTVSELAWKNGLYEGTLRIGDRQVQLQNIKVPLLHVVAQYDSMVNAECSRPLVEGVGSTDKEELVLPGGHLSLVAGPAAIRRMWPKLDQWLGKRSV
ncbi:Poly(3-hydroxyalkanoate) polymerase subunit PhaC [compost metagenome]